VLGVAAIAVLASPGGAEAGRIRVGNMVATPDPATTEQTVTIANQPGDDNTCEAPIATLTATPAGIDLPIVTVEVYSPSDTLVAEEDVEADENGDWSVTVGPFAETGTYTAEAVCIWDSLQKFASPSRAANFQYIAVDFEVVEVPPSSSTTTTTAAPTTTAAAAAATAAPRFTG
jgi:hypothetical protein